MLNEALDKVMMVKESVKNFVIKGMNGQLTFRQRAAGCSEPAELSRW
jgi:hypothetical protein